ncbi:MAG: hypothetical protein PV344_00880, partial [Anaplasma sp.]|nr:hypothetical protein [Anaplasma sp.]
MDQWVLQFEDYNYAFGLHLTTGEVQARTLLYAMGSQEARHIQETLTLTQADWGSMELTKQKFRDHFIRPLNEVYESVRFHSRVQEAGESVDSFYTALCTLVNKCHYQSAEVEDRLVQDHFVVGLLGSCLSDKLCRCPKLRIEEARLQARIHEDAVKARTAVFQEGAHSLHVIAEAKFKKCQRKSPFVKPRAGEESFAFAFTAKNCRFCGRGSHQRSVCSAKQAKCRYRKRRGHFNAVGENKRGLSTIQLHYVTPSGRTT